MAKDRIVDRYELLGELATGGMGTVYLARQHGPHGFARTVAVKSMLPQFAKDPSFRAMFLDEATLSATIAHPNVVPTLDVVAADDKLLLVMQYVEGASLAALAKEPLPPAAALTIVGDLLQGLHAAHELKGRDASSLGVVHRDVSPQNILVGVDGQARVTDFGIAKAAGRRHVTMTGELKGKLAYMAPEQVRGEAVDRRADVYSAGAVLWELLAGRKVFLAANDAELARKIVKGTVEPPSLFAEEMLPEALDRVVLRALAVDPEERWPTAMAMASALAELMPAAERREIGALVRARAATELAERERLARQEQRETAAPHEVTAVETVLTRHVTASEITIPCDGERGLRRIAIAIGVIASAIAIGGAVAFARREPPAPTPAVTGPEATTAPGAVAPVTSAPPADAAAPPHVVSDSASPPASAFPPSPPAAHAPAASRATPRASASARDCSVPYSVDAKGHRHYDPACVE